MSGNSPKVIVIVDLQRAYVAEAYAGPEIVNCVAGLVARARAADVLVVLVQYDGDPGSMVEPFTAGWELVPELEPVERDVVLRKRSADAFAGTDLAHILRAAGAGTIVLAGYASDYCVASTARSALSHGFDVELVEDGHTTVADRADIGDDLTPESVIRHHNAVLASLLDPAHRVTVVRSDQITLP